MASKRYVCCLVLLFLLVTLISGQDIPAENPEVSPSPPPSSPVPPTTAIPPTTSTIFTKQPEETTPSATQSSVDPSVGPPDFNRNLFKWTQYRKIRDGICYDCGCYQLKHFRDTCECFNYYIHAKANLLRRMYIKRSPWYPCQQKKNKPAHRDEDRFMKYIHL